MKEMNETTAINIGLHIDHRVIDLRIPNRVTLSRLGELLQDSLILLGIILPEKFSLKLLNKPIQMNREIQLSHYPLGNGDQIALIIGTDEEEGIV